MSYAFKESALHDYGFLDNFAFYRIINQKQQINLLHIFLCILFVLIWWMRREWLDGGSNPVWRRSVHGKFILSDANFEDWLFFTLVRGVSYDRLSRRDVGFLRSSIKYILSCYSDPISQLKPRDFQLKKKSKQRVLNLAINKYEETKFSLISTPQVGRVRNYFRYQKCYEIHSFQPNRYQPDKS